MNIIDLMKSLTIPIDESSLFKNYNSTYIMKYINVYHKFNFSYNTSI